jgi:hypothetical protein
LGQTAPLRHLPLTSAKSDAGVGLTATATGGAMGISRTAGTSLELVGEATSVSTKTDKAMFEFDLPDTYNAGQPVLVDVWAAVGGSGTLVAASTTLTVAAYSETNGVEAALTVTNASQEIVQAGGDLYSTIAATGLAPGNRMVLELTMAVDSSAGANTGQIGKVAYSA